jgi:hypothetical protein
VTRIVGTVIRPRRTLRDIVANPTWGRPALVLALLTALAGAALMSTETGRLALVDQWERTGLAFGGRIDDAEYTTLRWWGERAGVAYGVGSALVRGPVLSLAVAVGLYLALRANATPQTGLGAGPSFQSVLAVVVHASAVLALRDLLAAPATYVRESMTSVGTLSLWLPAGDVTSPAARLLGTLDLLVVWWLVVLAIGIGVLYRRPSRPLAVTFVGLYVGVALVLTAATAMLDTGT